MPWFENLETGLQWYVTNPEHVKMLRKNKEAYKELEKPVKTEEKELKELHEELKELQKETSKKKRSSK